MIKTVEWTSEGVRMLDQRLLPNEYLDESKTMVTQAFYDYALPLVGEPLPYHARIEITRVKKP